MDITKLLDEIKAINQKYENELKQTGETFNIFNILGLDKDENSHSKIIKEFLDPYGSHGMGDTFLKIFFKIINIPFNNESIYYVKKENFISNISDDHEEGGRIDIIITNNHQQIIIENKIYAGDQKNQLLRYHNYDKYAILYYLTLDGREATEYSTGSKEFIYHSISYKSHIMHWLEECMKMSEGVPIVRETIRQYIILIKQLTNQSRRDKMRDECIKTISKNGNYVTAAFVVYENFDELRDHIIQEIFYPKLKERINKYGLVLRGEKSVAELFGPKNNPGSFSLYNSDWKYIEICFEFEEHSSGLTYGIKWSNDQEKPIELSEYFKKYAEDLNFANNGFWPLSKKMNKYANWNKDFFSEIVENDSDIMNVFEDTINELLSAVNGFQGEK